MFHIIPDAAIISRSSGIYRQHKVYQYKGRIFVGHAGGYVYVTRNGTSAPKLWIDELHLPFPAEYNSLGYLIVPDSYNKEQNK